MAAGQGNPRRRTDRGAAGQDLADGLHRQLVDGHADDGQGQDRGPAHGVDVGERIGRRDAAEVEGVVDHGHEEVGGGHQGLGVVQPPDRGVVGGLRAHHQVGEGRGGRHVGQDLLQHGRRDLAPAATAVGEGGQANGVRHGHVLEGGWSS